MYTTWRTRTAMHGLLQNELEDIDCSLLELGVREHQLDDVLLRLPAHTNITHFDMLTELTLLTCYEPTDRTEVDLKITLILTCTCT